MYWNINGDTLATGLPTVIMAIVMWWVVYKLLTHKGTKPPKIHESKSKPSYYNIRVYEEENYGFIDFGKKK